MKKHCLILMVIFVSIMAAGCASGLVTHQTPPPPITPTANSAVICFLRDSAFMGGGVSFDIKEGEHIVGGLKNGSFFRLPVTPGQHTYTVTTETTDAITIDVAPGQEYYLQAFMSWGFAVAHPHLKQVASDHAKVILPKLKYVSLKQK